MLSVPRSSTYPSPDLESPQEDPKAPRKISLPSFDLLLKATIYSGPVYHGYTYNYTSPFSIKYPISPPLQPRTIVENTKSLSNPPEKPVSVKEQPPQSTVIQSQPLRMHLDQKPSRQRIPPTFEEMTSVFVSDPDFEKNIRKFKCQTCDKRFKTVGHLSRHKQVHSPGRAAKKMLRKTPKFVEQKIQF